MHSLSFYLITNNSNTLSTTNFLYLLTGVCLYLCLNVCMSVAVAFKVAKRYFQKIPENRSNFNFVQTARFRRLSLTQPNKQSAINEKNNYTMT